MLNQYIIHCINNEVKLINEENISVEVGHSQNMIEDLGLYETYCGCHAHVPRMYQYYNIDIF